MLELLLRVREELLNGLAIHLDLVLELGEHALDELLQSVVDLLLQHSQVYGEVAYPLHVWNLLQVLASHSYFFHELLPCSEVREVLLNLFRIYSPNDGPLVIGPPNPLDPIEECFCLLVHFREVCMVLLGHHLVELGVSTDALELRGGVGCEGAYLLII